MSDTTYEALDAALKAHVADENPGALVTAWATSVAYVTEDPGSDRYLFMKAENQGNYATIGLFQIGLDGVNTFGWSDQ